MLRLLERISNTILRKQLDIAESYISSIMRIQTELKILREENFKSSSIIVGRDRDVVVGKNNMRILRNEKRTKNTYPELFFY